MTDKTYIMIGAPIITKEIFRNILRPLNNCLSKPSGGFWSSKYISNIYSISDWFTYLLDADSIARYKNLNDSVIFTLKEDAKILTIQNYNDVLKLIEKYPSYHQILSYYGEITPYNTDIDFEALSKDYDGVYAEVNNFLYSSSTNIFNNWSVNTLLLFNLDCIKEYHSVPIIFDIDDPYSIPYIDTDRISTAKQVPKESTYHLELSKIAGSMYEELMQKFRNYSFEDYDEYLSTVIDKASICIDHLLVSEEEKVKEIPSLLREQHMLVDSSQVVRNIVLNYLANYLNKDRIRNTNLPKSKIKTWKSYSIH